ncbi:MAG: hypothetical protein GTO55_07235 [Armatimonadetes bacterium]|nr:hypothetical protein [Armatimonadota bacterium]NIM24064.1 hypothetical protein [Armatimonadota bacterium]NIM67918.1 hypothetical protein [Armatimonadota bacterium]NIM76440.1 hypothetical protein [Armatimonadota bacterium]NIN06148.1 hypothetical protein [Armatimonadota bacterium]
MLRKKWVIVLGIVLVAAVILAAYAQQATRHEMMYKMGDGMMKGKGMGMMGMCPMHCGMMGHMMGGAAITAHDDHIYVFSGRKLQKYDANLMLVKETHIKVDMKKMKMMGEEMMKQCPMYKKMMEQQEMMQK